jgi:hypothetical protein
MATPDERTERIGELADRLDNLLAATNLPMSPEFHLRQVKVGLEEISKELKAIYKDAAGVDPWSVTQ